jgi:hypothetical protein
MDVLTAHASDFPVPYTHKTALNTGKKFVAALTECAKLTKFVACHRDLLGRLGKAQHVLVRAASDCQELQELLSELQDFRSAVTTMVDGSENIDFGPVS